MRNYHPLISSHLYNILVHSLIKTPPDYCCTSTPDIRLCGPCDSPPGCPEDVKKHIPARI